MIATSSILLGVRLALTTGPRSHRAGSGSRAPDPLWKLYESTLASAKYIDLTHAIAPGGPIGEGFSDFKVGPTRAGVGIPGVIGVGEPFTYEKQGDAITAYALPMDHIGTQFGPPAHLNEHGATIDDIPPTVSLRPRSLSSMSRRRSRSTPALPKPPWLDIAPWERAPWSHSGGRGGHDPLRTGRRSGAIPSALSTSPPFPGVRPWTRSSTCTWSGTF